MAKSGSELFYLDDSGKKQDRELHQEILDEGDHEAAMEVSRKVMRDLGLDPSVLLPTAEEKRKKAWAKVRAEAEARAKGSYYDEAEHPRDDHGRWTDSGGDEGGGSVGGSSGGGKIVTGVKKLKEQWNTWMAASKITDVDSLMAAAETDQDTLVKDGKALAKATGAKLVNPGVKKRATVEKKLTRDPKNPREPKELADVVRAGFIVKTPGQATRIIEALGKKYEVMDEGWKKTPQGYFDRKALIKMPNGSLAEFQLWPTEMFDAKMKHGGHKLYEKWRGLNKASVRAKQLEAEMVKLYGKVDLPEFWKSVIKLLEEILSGQVVLARDVV